MVVSSKIKSMYRTALRYSGSDKYGEALESLPQIEAVPDDSAIMRYKLVTLDRTRTCRSAST